MQSWALSGYLFFVARYRCALGLRKVLVRLSSHINEANLLCNKRDVVVLVGRWPWSGHSELLGRSLHF
jgi:hypothetical protein